MAFSAAALLFSKEVYPSDVASQISNVQSVLTFEFGFEHVEFVRFAQEVGVSGGHLVAEKTAELVFITRILSFVVNNSLWSAGFAIGPPDDFELIVA